MIHSSLPQCLAAAAAAAAAHEIINKMESSETGHKILFLFCFDMYPTATTAVGYVDDAINI